MSDIELLPEGGVLLTLSMEADHRLSHEYVPRIGVDSFITGDAKLEFVKADPERLDQLFEGNAELIQSRYADGDYLSYGDKADDPFSVLFGLEDEMRDTMQSVRGAGQAIEQAGTSVEELSGQIQALMGDGRSDIQDLAQQSVRTLEEFQLAIQDVRRVINAAGVQQTAESLPDLVEEARATLQLSQDSFQSLARAGDQFEAAGRSLDQVTSDAGKVVNNVERFTRPLGDRGEEIVAQAIRTLGDLDRTLVQVEQFTRKLNQGEGTLQQLLEDDELYWRVRRTVENVEHATARIRPILDDVRVFTDKIARDPRQLGVRGALTPRPSGYGLK